MRSVFLLTLLSLSACSLFTGGGLDVTADPPELVLDNEADRPVYYVAIEANAAAKADLIPDVTAWPSLTAGETRRIAYDDLDGYEPGDTEAVVFWSTGRGYVQESVRL